MIVNLQTEFTCTFSSIVVILLNNLRKRDLEKFKFVYPQFKSDKTEKEIRNSKNLTNVVLTVRWAQAG